MLIGRYTRILLSRPRRYELRINVSTPTNITAIGQLLKFKFRPYPHANTLREFTV